MVKLDTQERGDKKVLENPGADALLARWGGAKAGLPFIVILDANGNKLADSNRLPGGNNIGCPASTAEISEFGKMLQETAPAITPDERDKIAARFKELNEKR